MEGSALHLENRTQVIVWLRENYKHATTTSVSKRSVFAHYLEACKRQSVATPISHTYFGKLVRKAFPDVRCNRKGPRGSAQQHYRLIRADGGDADEFLSAHFGDELEAEAAAEEEYRAKRAKRSSNKKKTTAAALRKNGVSATAGRVRVRAAATAAASTISRMISADQAPANLTEAWSFSSAPSSPSFSATASVPSSPGAQAYAESDEDDDHDEEYTEELIEEEYVEEEHQEPELEQEEDEDGGDDDEDDAYESDDASSTGANANEEVEFNFDLPQFEITPGEESPGTSFSYEAGHSISGHEQNLRLQQQLQQSLPASTQAQAQFAIPQPPQQQQQQSMSYFEPSAFYDFVSPDLEMPLSAINQVNLAEDFGWSVPSMPSAVLDNCASAYHHQQAHYYQQHQHQQPVHSYLLADQLPATQCSDLAEWVAHYCN